MSDNTNDGPVVPSDVAEQPTEPAVATENPEATAYVQMALDQTSTVFPETGKLLLTLQGLLPEGEFVRAVIPCILELAASTFKTRAPSPYAMYVPPPPMPRDPEEEALSEVLTASGVCGLGFFGGGIFGEGTALEKRESTEEKMLAHVKMRVKESYDKGYAEGREALLKEQLDAETSA